MLFLVQAIVLSQSTHSNRYVKMIFSWYIRYERCKELNMVNELHAASP